MDTSKKGDTIDYMALTSAYCDPTGTATCIECGHDITPPELCYVNKKTRRVLHASCSSRNLQAYSMLKGLL